MLEHLACRERNINELYRQIRIAQNNLDELLEIKLFRQLNKFEYGNG